MSALSKILIVILVCAAGPGCVSGAKRLRLIEAAVDKPEELNKLCADEVMGACALLGQNVRPERLLPILQSVSSEHQARFVIMVPAGRAISYFQKSGKAFKALRVEILPALDGKNEVHHIESFDLRPNEQYELLVLGGNGNLWDRREFKGLDTKKKNARIAVVSCSDDSYVKIQEQMWTALADAKPDALILLGDNVYADKVDHKRVEVNGGEDIWRRYGETRERLQLFKLNPLIPTVATWDDHDYGKNDGDRTFPHKLIAADVFFAFFHQKKPAPNFARGPGVSSWWKSFGVNWVLLDDRTFRSPNQMESDDQTHFGSDQEKWLAEVMKSTKTPLLLASGDQFFGGYHSFESYEGSHPKSFKKILKEWRLASKTPMVFLSGDRHLAEILKVSPEHLGYRTYELTSSGIHAHVFPDAFEKAPSPAQLAGVAGEYNFSLIEIEEASSKRLRLGVKAVGLGQKEHYRKTLTVRRP